jgi:hypothetical protein
VRQLGAFYRPTPNQFNEEQCPGISCASRITVRTQNPFAVPFSRSNGGVFVYVERVATAVLPLPPDLGKLPL